MKALSINSSARKDGSMTARITQVTSKAILTLPNSLWVVSDIAFTKASPELRITFAVTESDIPNPSMMIKIILNILRRNKNE